MKIGLVLDDSLDKPDGVQQYVLTVGHWLTTKGHEVHYLVGETTRTDIPRVHSLSRNMSVRFNGNRMSIPYPANGKKIQAVLSDGPAYDVLYVQSPYSPMLGGKIVSRANATTAVVGIFHILPFSALQTYATKALGLWLHFNLQRFDTMVGTSRPAADFVRSAFGLESGVIPNTVDLSVFAGGGMLPRYNDGKINIVFLGRLVERKGCMQLLIALKTLVSKNPLIQVRVIVCGRGPLQPELEKYVFDNNLGVYVEFVGFIEEVDKPNYLASAHIAVFPALGGESFGIVLIEAMAAGTEVVLGGDNPGYHSVLGMRPDQLFDPKNTDALAVSLQHFIDDPIARQNAKMWQSTAVGQYDVNVVGAQLVSMFEAAIAKRRK